MPIEGIFFCMWMVLWIVALGSYGLYALTDSPKQYIWGAATYSLLAVAVLTFKENIRWQLETSEIIWLLILGFAVSANLKLHYFPSKTK